MFDFTSILYALVVSFGIFGLDAAWNADTVKTEFLVADTIEQAGIKREFAAVAFSRELRDIFATESLIRPPLVRSSHDKTFVSILADSVGMKEATRALQDLFGLHPVQIVATLTNQGERQRIEIIGEAGTAGSFYVSLDGEPGEQAISLIRRGALESAIHLDPYHTALSLLDPAEGAPDVVRAKRLIDGALAMQVATPENPVRARFRNLRGVVALLENDKETAAKMFEQAVADDATLTPAHLNLAFTRVEQDRYSDAAMIARNVLQSRQMITTPALTASAHTILGVASWAMQRTTEAEVQFGAAVAALPIVSDAYFYWGRMLAELGRTAEAREKTYKGDANLATFENYPEVALLFFWLTPKDDQPLQRRPRGKPVVVR